MTEPDDTSPETLQEYFVVQLRRFRHDRGLSQTQLAERINFSPGLISMVETLQRNPTADFTAACDAALDTGGALSALLPMLAREAYPTWFRSFAALEAEAVGIEDFEVQLVPGLLQTEDYARAVFELAWPRLGSGKLLPEPRDVDRAARALNVVRSEALSARESIARIAFLREKLYDC